MLDKTISTYLSYFKKLNRSSHAKLGKAPHKPVLLLSVLQLIRSGVIRNNRIFITPDLVLAFKSNWNILVETHHTCNFSLPFFHMKSEPFWTLTFLSPKGSSLKSISTLNVLKDFVAFAEIDVTLFSLLGDTVTNFYFEEALLELYFPNTRFSYKGKESQEYLLETEIKNEIVNESSEVYQLKMKEMVLQLSEEEVEEERFIRGGIFKKEIPRIYHNQCCISGMRIETTINAQMVDACHIRPFSISNDDTISNGICLSPNLHRAFDRGLLTINDDFIVRISPTVIESESVYSIKQFEGKRINLPENSKHYPSPFNFQWHQKEKFVL